MSSLNTHQNVTGFSGNEIYCLSKLGYRAGPLCLGNNVLALGVFKGITSSLSNLAGGEITEITQLVHDGRLNAYNRMMTEAQANGGIGIAGVTFDIVSHSGNLEFIAMGSTVYEATNATSSQLDFSTSASGQALYCQQDAGFTPHRFVFSNVAYSIGIGGNITGAIRRMKRGEVPEYTEIFNRTRHLALERIKNEAKTVNANAVIGIETSILPLLGAQEMMMTGTASSHPALRDYEKDPVTCAMTNEELWNIVNLGYMPIQLVLGVSVYSLGLVSGVTSFLKSLAGGQVNSLTEILYEAREKALARIQQEANACGADEVLGVTTRVYDLGGGLVEFMVLGTAVKKINGVTTKQENLIPQAIIQERDTFIESSFGRDVRLTNGRAEGASSMQRKPTSLFAGIFGVIGAILLQVIK